jgi:hypothetical protein
MKIVVTSTGKSKIKKYLIEVFDGNTIIHTESTQGIQNRDTVVWRLADLYDLTEIEMRDAKVDEFKFTDIPSIPVLEFEEADVFFDENSEFVYERILQAVQEGLIAKRNEIRLFELNGTGVYITSNRPDWKEGVQQALDHFVLMERYDKCIAARQLLQKL